MAFIPCVVDVMLAHIEDSFYVRALKVLIRFCCGYSHHVPHLDHSEMTVISITKNLNQLTVIKKWRFWHIFFWIQSLFLLMTFPPVLYLIWSNAEQSSQTIFLAQMINGSLEVISFFSVSSILLYRGESLAELLYYLKWICADGPKMKFNLRKDFKWNAFILFNVLSVCCLLGFEYLVLKSRQELENNALAPKSIWWSSGVLLTVAIISRAILVCSFVLLFHCVCRSMENMWRHTMALLIPNQKLRNHDHKDEMNHLILKKLKSSVDASKDEQKNIESSMRETFDFEVLNLVGTRVSRLLMLHQQVCFYFSLPMIFVVVNSIFNIIVNVFTFTVMPFKYSIGSIGTVNSTYNLIFLCCMADQVDEQVR